MRFTSLDRPLAGVSVPIFSLKSGSGCGTGEYPDLALLAPWCASCGLEVVQLLPVNDSGSLNSPYSALSAFALHPLYIRLDEVAGTGSYAEEIRGYRASTDARPRLDYARTLAFKLSVLERIFKEERRAIASDRAFAQWREETPWVASYAAFRALEREHGGAPWTEWAADAAGRVPGAASPPQPGVADAASAASAVADAWKRFPDACQFHAWVQRIAEGQLRAAAQALQRAGVMLKGDLPILMCEHSADVWRERSYFDLSFRAGAPPDMFSPTGQNWDFPVYDWESMASDGYRWWKARLAQAAKFYHAFRIDHVLGFFRIWRIPKDETSGVLGGFAPYEAIRRDELSAAGFGDGRVRWLSVPHTSGEELANALGPEAARVARLYLDRVDNEDLFTVKPAFDREKAISALAEPEQVKRFLLERHVDRSLLEDGDGVFHPSWYHARSRSWAGLTPDERGRLAGILHDHRARSEAIWEKRGHELLAMAQSASDMLVCAEDLGDVPDCVPRVLLELGILGLRIERWARRWKEPGQPFIPPAEYPWLTVSTPSVHDTSTLRGWWEEDRLERETYWPTLGLGGSCPERLGPEAHEAILARLMASGSAICVLQLQELLDLEPSLRSADPRVDRINVPGTIADTNWSWRMPLAIEKLLELRSLAGRIRTLIAVRRGVPPRDAPRPGAPTRSKDREAER